MASKVTRADIHLTNPSDRTIAERNKFAAQLDDFATFTWAGFNMFNEFGAFIINEKKGSLKLYNGPSFKNNYSKPQFQDGYTNLTGITFDTQTISFTIGVWWISIEDYRLLMNTLHPYDVNMLSFDFEKQYGYMCKLQAIKDSTRYVVGQETTGTTNSTDSLNYSRIESGNAGSKYRYYTELNLTFDVIGTQCAKELTPHYRIFDHWEQTISGQNVSSLLWKGDQAPDFRSDLDYPFKVTFPLLSLSPNQEEGTINITAQLEYYQHGDVVARNSQSLCTIGLKNITTKAPISLYYDSEHGLVYWSLGDKYQLIHLLSTQSNGQRILQSLDVKSFYWPGRFTFPEVESDDCVFTLTVTLTNIQLLLQGGQNAAQYITYAAQRRTNVL